MFTNSDMMQPVMDAVHKYTAAMPPGDPPSPNDDIFKQYAHWLESLPPNQRDAALLLTGGGLCVGSLLVVAFGLPALGQALSGNKSGDTGKAIGTKDTSPIPVTHLVSSTFNADDNPSKPDPGSNWGT